MSLSKVLMPEDVVLSNNVIPVTVETDKYRTTLGTKQVITLTCYQNTTAGEILTFNWLEFNMPLTFSGSPNDSGMQLPLYDGATAAGYDDLLAALKSNYYLDKYFVITLSTSFITGFYRGVITFTQRSFGQEWSAVSVSSTEITEFEPVITTAQVMPAYGANFRFLCDLWYQSNPSSARSYSNLITQLDASGNDENIGKFNLSEIFKKWKMLKPDFPVDITFQECVNVIKNYYLVLSESYGSVELVNNNITEPDSVSAGTYKQVILGGLPYLKHINSTFIDDYIDATYNKFLTNHISGKTVVCKQMQHWLYWYQKSSVTDLILKVTLYQSDGTSVNATKTTFSGSSGAKKIYQIGVGYNDLELDLLLTGLNEPVKYEVWVEDAAATRLTEKFMFELDLRYNMFNNFFYYHNALGGVDTEWFTGDVQLLPEITGTEIVKATINDYAEGNIDIVNSKTRYGYVVNTGFKQNKNEIDALKEMFQSNYVRFLPDPLIRPGYTDVFDLMKVVVDKGSIGEWVNEQDSIYALSFTILEGHYEW